MSDSKFFTTEVGHLDGLDFYTIKSDHLQGRGDVLVYRSQQADLESLPLVILLHGVYGSHWVWALKAQVHKTLQKMVDEGSLRPMILALPSDGLFEDGSAYLAHKKRNFEKWIVEDVITLVAEKVEPFELGSSPVFIAGLSMGGYGALRLGAKYPKIFNAFSGHSSITKYDEMGHFIQDMGKLNEQVRFKEDVLQVILENRDSLRPFRFDCGTDDPLISGNRALHQELQDLKISHVYEEFGGGHEWEYWTEQVKKSLLFFDSAY